MISSLSSTKRRFFIQRGGIDFDEDEFTAMID